jgi:hypothetical protein
MMSPLPGRNPDDKSFHRSHHDELAAQPAFGPSLGGDAVEQFQFGVVG